MGKFISYFLTYGVIVLVAVWFWFDHYSVGAKACFDRGGQTYDSLSSRCTKIERVP